MSKVFLCILLELSLVGHVHLENSARAHTVLQQRSFGLSQSGYLKYRCLLLRLSQGPNFSGNVWQNVPLLPIRSCFRDWELCISSLDLHKESR